MHEIETCIESRILLSVLDVVLYFLQQFYLRTFRQMQLLESVITHLIVRFSCGWKLLQLTCKIETKASIVSLFLDIIQKLTTIRAFEWSQAFTQRNLSLLNELQKSFYLLFCVQRWLFLVLFLIVVALKMLVMKLIIALRTSVSLDLIELIIVQVTTFIKVMSDLIIQWTKMKTCFEAVTWIFRFTKKTSRKNCLSETTTLFDEWSLSGFVILKNVSASYE